MYDDAGKKMVREKAEKMQLVSGLELDVLVININKGYSEELKKSCRLLGEYMIYVDRVRKYTPLYGLNEAVRRAVNECIDEGERNGERKGKIDSLLMFLRAKGEVSEALEAFIRETKALETLTKWTELAIKSTSVKEFEQRVRE